MSVSWERQKGATNFRVTRGSLLCLELPSTQAVRFGSHVSYNNSYRLHSNNRTASFNKFPQLTTRTPLLLPVQRRFTPLSHYDFRPSQDSSRHPKSHSMCTYRAQRDRLLSWRTARVSPRLWSIFRTRSMWYCYDMNCFISKGLLRMPSTSISLILDALNPRRYP